MEGALPDGHVAIEKKWLDSLMQAERILNVLEEFGVDNWEGYGDALQALEERENS